jgi:biopolymer transport protein ExbD
MITRPLNLASHLRTEPRNFDLLFLVNAGLLALFFVVFASRFVLSPGLAVDFRIPAIAGATAGATLTTHQVTITQSGVFFVESGRIDLAQLKDWLKKEGQRRPEQAGRSPTLNILADARLTVADLAEVVRIARSAGFEVQWGAVEPEARGK